MSSNAASSHEEQLHLKMCKKVADLTRVIDKLFRQFYEQSGVLCSLQTRHKQLTLEKERIDNEKKHAVNEVKACREEIRELKVNNQRLNGEINKMEARLADCQKDKENVLGKVDRLEQCLMQARQEIDSLKSINNDLMESNKATESCKDHIEIIDTLKLKLEQSTASYTALTNERDRLHADFTELQNRHDKVIDEYQQVKENMKTCQDTIESLQSEKCGLQLKITHLLKEVQELRCVAAKKAAAITDNKPMPSLTNKGTKPPGPHEYWLQQTKVTTRDDEVEQLRQEIQRYRLELMNRESNFNRVFTEHNPIHIRETRRISGGPSRGNHAVQLPRLQSSKSMGIRR